MLLLGVPPNKLFAYNNTKKCFAAIARHFFLFSLRAYAYIIVYLHTNTTIIAYEQTTFDSFWPSTSL